METRPGQAVLSRGDTGSKTANLPTYMDIGNFLPVMLIKSVSYQVTFWELAEAEGTKRKNHVKQLIKVALSS